MAMTLTDRARQSLAKLLETESAEAVANAAGVTRMAIVKIADGRTAKISTGLIDQLCTSRGITPQEFLGLEAQCDHDLIASLVAELVQRVAAHPEIGPIDQELAQAIGEAVVTAYEDAQRFGIRAENRPALSAVTDVLVRSLAPRARD